MYQAYSDNSFEARGQSDFLCLSWCVLASSAGYVANPLAEIFNVYSPDNEAGGKAGIRIGARGVAQPTRCVFQE